MRKDWLKTFEYKGSLTKDDQTVSCYEKVTDEYRILYDIHSNKYGGKSIITVEILPELGEKDGIYHLRSPVLSFFATGFEDFAMLEKRIKEEIVPALKKWAIKVL